MKRSLLARSQLPPVAQSADNIRPPKAMRSSAPPIVAILFLTGISFLGGVRVDGNNYLTL